MSENIIYLIYKCNQCFCKVWTRNVAINQLLSLVWWHKIVGVQTPIVGRSTWKRQEISWKVVGLCVLVSAVMQCSSFLVITSIGVMFLFWLPWFVCLLAKLYRVVMKL